MVSWRWLVRCLFCLLFVVFLFLCFFPFLCFPLAGLGGRSKGAAARSEKKKTKGAARTNRQAAGAHTQPVQQRSRRKSTANTHGDERITTGSADSSGRNTRTAQRRDGTDAALRTAAPFAPSPSPSPCFPARSAAHHCLPVALCASFVRPLAHFPHTMSRRPKGGMGQPQTQTDADAATRRSSSRKEHAAAAARGEATQCEARTRSVALPVPV